jgi:hypothetical protein
MRVTKSLGRLLLAIFLLVYGLSAFIRPFEGMAYILAGLAIAAGVCLLLDR